MNRPNHSDQVNVNMPFCPAFFDLVRLSNEMHFAESRTQCQFLLSLFWIIHCAHYVFVLPLFLPLIMNGYDGVFNVCSILISVHPSSSILLTIAVFLAIFSCRPFKDKIKWNEGTKNEKEWRKTGDWHIQCAQTTDAFPKKLKEKGIETTCDTEVGMRTHSVEGKYLRTTFFELSLTRVHIERINFPFSSPFFRSFSHRKFF